MTSTRLTKGSTSSKSSAFGSVFAPSATKLQETRNKMPRRERPYDRKSGSSPNNVEFEFSYHDKNYMRIKLTCRKVAIKFTVLFCATFLSMWICCAVMALGGDIQGRNLFIIVSAFCILSLYHIISCYHQTLTLSEYEIILKRGLETWRIRYEEVERIIFHTQVSMPPFDKPDIFIRSPKTTIHFRENWFDDNEIFQRAMDTIYQRTPQVHVVKNGKGIDVNMYTFVSALKYMFIPFLMLVFLLSLLVS